jgi:hypothetical protein
VRTKQLDIAGAEEQVARLEGLVKEAKGATDKVQKEFNALSEKASEELWRYVRLGYCLSLLHHTVWHNAMLGLNMSMHCTQWWLTGCCCCYVCQVSKLHHDLEEAVHTNTQLLADSSSKQVELRGKEEELAALRVEMAKVVKVRLPRELLALSSLPVKTRRRV